MSTLFYLRLFGLTAGTLVQLFWIVLILGYRRPRNFERVLFFVGLALFLFYSGSLLALNAEIYYPIPPPALLSFAVTRARDRGRSGAEMVRLAGLVGIPARPVFRNPGLSTAA